MRQLALAPARRQGSAPDARRNLQLIHRGFATPDLKDAKAGSTN